MSRVRVMIVDDQRLAREYFGLVIGACERYEVVHSIESAAFADTYVLRGGVDLVIMDVLMNDGSNGLKAAWRIKRANPKIKVIAVTSIPEASWMDEARRAGVDSFWYKDVSAETLVEIMDRTMAGERLYPVSAPVARVGLAKSTDFTKREVQILRALVDGLSNDQIAKRMHLSAGTIKTHVQHLLDKTGCENRTRLAVLARASGLVVDL